MAAAASGAPAAASTAAPTAAAAPAAAGAKSDIAPILQQLNLTALRTRMNDLQGTIHRITHTFHTNPSSKWPEVLGQFSIVNLELLSLVEDIKPILRAFVVYPKNVNAEIAPILPIMLSSKLLPELEAEEAAMKEQVLAPLSNLPLHVQTEKLQKQIELVRTVCDMAEKVLADARKNFGLGARQGLPSIATIDKAQAAKILEQEKLLHAAANFGEGLRISSDQRNAPTVLPPHIASALAAGDQGTDGMGYPRTPSTGGIQPTTPQQIIANAPLNGTQAPPLAYANSPRHDMQSQQQAAFLQQRAKAQQLQLQKQLMQQHLRQPATPPLPQLQVANQSGQQSLLQQQPAKMQQFAQSHLQQLQQQQQAQLHQHIQAQQERHRQQFQLQQLHNNTQLQAAQNQNPQQGSQLRPQIGNYGNAQSSILSPNMVTNLNQSGLSQPSLQQRLQFGVGLTPQSQRNQMLADPYPSINMFTAYMGLSGGTQSAASLGLPLQQQLSSQSSYGLINPNQNTLLNSAPNNMLASNHGSLLNPNNLLTSNQSLLNQGGLLNTNTMAFNQPRQQPPSQ